MKKPRRKSLTLIAEKRTPAHIRKEVVRVMAQTYAPKRQATSATVYSGKEAKQNSPQVSMDSMRSMRGLEDGYDASASPGGDFDDPMGGGRRINLSDAMQAKMQRAFGLDISGVKFYESQKVKDAGANALAQGNQVSFAPGKADFSTRKGQALLGHELSHIASQARGQVKGDGLLLDDSLEARADREGEMAASGKQVVSENAAPVAAPAAAGPVQGSFFGDLWGSIKKGAKSAFGAAKKGLKSAWGGIKSGAKGLWSNIKGGAKGIWGGIKGGAKGVWSSIKGGAKGVWSNLKGGFSDAWSNLKEGKLADAWNSVKSGASNALGAAKEGVSGAIGNVRDAAGDVVSSAKDTVSGAKETVSGAAGAVKDAASNTISGAKDTVTGAVSTVKDSVTGAASDAKDAVTGTASDVKDAVVDKVSSVKQKGQELIDNAIGSNQDEEKKKEEQDAKTAEAAKGQSTEGVTKETKPEPEPAPAPKPEPEPKKEEKGFFGRASDWVSEKWNNAKKKVSSWFS